jgi:hypothetical protein
MMIVAALAVAGCLTNQPGVAVAGFEQRHHYAPGHGYDPWPHREGNFHPPAPYYRPRLAPPAYHHGPPPHRRYDPCVRTRRGAQMVRELGLYHQRVERVC